jgi:WD40 repeat protein
MVAGEQALWFMGHCMLMLLLKLGAAADICRLALDASKFATILAANPISRSTPHIYISMLPFWSKKAPMWSHYGTKLQGCMRIEGSGFDRRRLAPLAVWPLSAGIISVAVSPDGSCVLCGLSDGLIQILDAQSGEIVTGPLQGHKRLVHSVAYSADGARMLSGSADCGIRIWDSRSGEAIAGPFKGYDGATQSAVFSRDGARIIVASELAISIWDAKTGARLVGPFPDSHFATSVALSSDGTHILSCHLAGRLRIWDTRTGDRVALRFEPREDMNCSAYSTDGSYIASGSHDGTIRIWDSHTRDILIRPFTGHTSRVTSVAFHPIPPSESGMRRAAIT